MAAYQTPLSLGFSRQEHWSGLPFLSPMQESEKWKWSRSVVSDPQRPHGLQPTRLLRPWDSPGKSTGVGCHCLLRIKMLQGKKKKKNTGLFTWTIRHLKGSEIFSFQTKCLPKSTLIDKHFRGDRVGKVSSSSISLHLWLQHNCADLMSSSPWINPRDGAH